MEANLIWTKLAENEIEKLYEYYCENASEKTAIKIVNEIYRKAQILIKHPEIGHLELNLKNKKQTYRFLLQKRFKIIYYYNKSLNRIEIMDVFDTKQNPKKLGRNLR